MLSGLVLSFSLLVVVGLLLLWSTGSRRVGSRASERWLSSCGTNPAAPWQVGASGTTDQTGVPCTSKQTLKSLDHQGILYPFF